MGRVGTELETKLACRWLCEWLLHWLAACLLRLPACLAPALFRPCAVCYWWTSESISSNPSMNQKAGASMMTSPRLRRSRGWWRRAHLKHQGHVCLWQEHDGR